MEGSPSHGDARSSTVPTQDSLIGDLLTMDLGGPPVPAPTAVPVYSASSGLDLLGGGLDSLLSDPVAAPPPVAPASVGLLGDIFGLTAPAATSYIPPKQVC